VNRWENWKTWESRGENLDNQAFHGLIIKPFDNQTVSLPWLSRISDTSENQSARLDSDNQINISRLISCLGDQFHFRRAAFAQQLKSRVGLALANATVLRITLNLDGAPIISKSHTHPSHSETSRLLTPSLSLGIPVPRATQCMRGM
jgi:hypothetical protein